MANLERRVVILETTHRPQDELDGVSAVELERRITDRLNKWDEQRPDWFVKLINDPTESAKDMVRRLAMLGLLTPKQSLMLRHHSTMKRPGVTDGI